MIKALSDEGGSTISSSVVIVTDSLFAELLLAASIAVTLYVYEVFAAKLVMVYVKPDVELTKVVPLKI